MGAAHPPYSEAAWNAAIDAKATRHKTTLHVAMEAAHDREALGLDASVHAGAYRKEVIEEIAALLRRTDVTERDEEGDSYWRLADTAEFLLRELGVDDGR